MLEKTLESPLDCKEKQQVLPKENQSGIFIGRTDAEAETLILWPPDGKNWLIGKDPKAETDWGQAEKRTTEDEMGRRWVWVSSPRRWDGWMASPTQWIWVWVNSGSWWWTGRPGVLQSMGSQRVGHNWVTALNWTEVWIVNSCKPYKKKNYNSLGRWRYVLPPILAPQKEREKKRNWTLIKLLDSTISLLCI